MSSLNTDKQEENPMIGYCFIGLMILLVGMCFVLVWQWSARGLKPSLVVANAGVLVGLLFSCLSARYSSGVINKTLLIVGMAIATVAQALSMYLDHLDT
jgi:hypothetical protein